MGHVLAACVAFVGSHFVLSHPLRRPLVQRVGERGFLGIYSLVAFATLGWVYWAYITAPVVPLWWEPTDAIWAVGSAIMLVASILLMGSLIRNPALPHPEARAAESVPAATGVFAVTRHPMMWAFALWGVAHILVYPDPSNVTVAAAMIVLALVGAHLQDRKKAELQPDFWPVWQRRTSYWPFAAIARGDANFGGFKPHALAGGVVIWLVATWAHIPLAGWAAGVWRWIG
ncbi:MAG: NnrU family protein [Pseudomonadota bacterium]